jgi:transketolase
VANKIANRQVICAELLRQAQSDPTIFVLASDSRGSASMTDFVREKPEQFIETGIAEQNLVGIAAGMASFGLKPYVTSPACFLSMRSIEQVKVDVAYSHQPVRLIGISGGLSYGALGMSHHSLQDLAVMRAIPGIQIVLPADRHATSRLMQSLWQTAEPVYVRIGRNPVEDVYPDDDMPFAIGKAIRLHEGCDATIIACGEMVRGALDAALALERAGIGCRVLDMHTIKPLDEAAIVAAAPRDRCCGDGRRAQRPWRPGRCGGRSAGPGLPGADAYPGRAGRTCHPGQIGGGFPPLWSGRRRHRTAGPGPDRKEIWLSTAGQQR